MFYTFRPTLLQQKVFSRFQWHGDREERKLYLTFDDGPCPGVTEWVLDLLKEHEAKASFFVVGSQVERFPHLVNQVLEMGHSIGNHTFSHPNGWKTETKKYIEDIEKCTFFLCKNGFETNLFRPPYGRVSFRQYQQLKNHRVVMWSLLSGDFDTNLNVKRSIRKLKSARNGDVLLFHDSKKAEVNLKRLLPVVLDYYSEKGFEFAAL